jgi:hypothetical protein
MMTLLVFVSKALPPIIVVAAIVWFFHALVARWIRRHSPGNT